MAIEEWEIWACANQVLANYGEDAELHAARRADELLEAGDMEGHFTWLRILRRIRQLSAPPPGRLH